MSAEQLVKSGYYMFGLELGELDQLEELHRLLYEEEI